MDKKAKLSLKIKKNVKTFGSMKNYPGLIGMRKIESK